MDSVVCVILTLHTPPFPVWEFLDSYPHISRTSQSPHDMHISVSGMNDDEATASQEKNIKGSRFEEQAKKR